LAKFSLRDHNRWWFLYGVAIIYYLITKREGMGGGDIKLLAMLGAFLGWRAVIFIVFLARYWDP